MWDNDEKGARQRHIQFANGFPPKGIVAQTLSGNVHNMHGGIFVGLQDDMSPQVGKQYRTIPPLAKGRGQFCSAKIKEDDNRFRRRPDPFRQHKPAEKTSFSAYPIKHARPKPTRPCKPPKPRTAQAPPQSPFSFKSLARKSVYASAGKSPESDRTPNSQETDSACVADVPVSPDGGRVKNFRVLSDVEKEFIQAELAGLEEVYQKICHGSSESLYGLLYPSRKNKKRTPVQYIQTSSPLLLRTVPKSPPHKRPEDKPVAPADGAREHLNEKTATELPQSSRVGQGRVCAEQALPKQEKARPILIPLPFFVADKPSQSPVFRHQKPPRDPPLVYNSKSAGKSKSVSLACPAAAVINFNPASPQHAKNAAPTGAIVGVQSRCSTGKLAVVAALPGHAPPPPTPYSCVESQTPAVPETEEEGNLRKIDSGTMEVESVESESSDVGASRTAEQNTPTSAAGDPLDNGVTEGDEKSPAEKEEFPVVSLITDEGEEGGVEIYLPEKKDVDKERRASVEIETLQMEGERKAKEFETLLREHKSIVDTVYELEKELKQKPPC